MLRTRLGRAYSSATRRDILVWHNSPSRKARSPDNWCRSASKNYKSIVSRARTWISGAARSSTTKSRQPQGLDLAPTLAENKILPKPIFVRIAVVKVKLSLIAFDIASTHNGVFGERDKPASGRSPCCLPCGYERRSHLTIAEHFSVGHRRQRIPLLELLTQSRS